MLYVNFPTWLKPEIIPGFPLLRWYGLMYLIAFAIAYYLFKIQIRENKIKTEEDEISNFIFWTIVGLLIGARIFSALIYDIGGEYWKKPWLIFWPFKNGRFVGLQGMSYHGGVIGALAGSIIYCKKNNKKMLLWGDFLAASIPLGYTFGRLGNFANSELYGRVTSSSLGVIFPNARKFSSSFNWVQELADKINVDITGNVMVNLPRHPSQLYEALFEGVVLWLILWFIIKNRKPFDGFVMAFYMIGYGIFRFFIEYFREPDAGLDFPLQLGAEKGPNYLLTSFLNFSTGQILCFIMISGGVVMITLLSFLEKKKKQQEIENKNMNIKKKKDMRKLRKKIK